MNMPDRARWRWLLTYVFCENSVLPSGDLAAAGSSISRAEKRSRLDLTGKALWRLVAVKPSRMRTRGAQQGGVGGLCDCGGGNPVPSIGCVPAFADADGAFIENAPHKQIEENRRQFRRGRLKPRRERKYRRPELGSWLSLLTGEVLGPKSLPTHTVLWGGGVWGLPLQCARLL